VNKWVEIYKASNGYVVEPSCSTERGRATVVGVPRGGLTTVERRQEAAASLLAAVEKTFQDMDDEDRGDE
jgi:hypothetical protein